MSVLNYIASVVPEHQPKILKEFISALEKNGHDVSVREYKKVVFDRGPHYKTSPGLPRYDLMNSYRDYYLLSNHTELGVKLKFTVIAGYSNAGTIQHKCYEDRFEFEIAQQELFDQALKDAWLKVTSQSRSEFGLFRKDRSFSITLSKDIKDVLALKGHPKKPKLNVTDLPSPLKFGQDKFTTEPHHGGFERCEFNRNIRQCVVKGVAVVGKNLSVTLDATQTNADPWFFMEVWGLKDSSEHIIVKPDGDELVFFPTRGKKNIFVSDNYNPGNKQIDFTQFSSADAEVVEFAMARYVQQLCHK